MTASTFFATSGLRWPTLVAAYAGRGLRWPTLVAAYAGRGLRWPTLVVAYAGLRWSWPSGLRWPISRYSGDSENFPGFYLPAVNRKLFL